ncbi:MAG TPA: VTT domain-containing protein [Gammaproteobacteria bacterium]|nr:VTT domain-containing protein [Gammaproteobacteria bacterium]
MCKRLLVLCGLLLIWGSAWYFDLGQVLRLEALQARLYEWQMFYASHPWLTIGGYILLFIVLTGASLPFAGVLALLAGALFGRWVGLLTVMSSAAAGATIAFLSARYWLRDWVRVRLAHHYQRLDAGFRQEGWVFLLTMRLIAFPFWILNLVMGLTSMDVFTFCAVSLIGLLPVMFILVSAGTELAQIHNLRDVLSPGLLGLLGLLALVILLMRFFAPSLVRWRQR